MPEIGATLREARMRARIDISEIEAETKIRAKYLRALENEEWGLLPGPTYVRTFLRTYAEALGLDAKLLLEEYKLRHERPSDHDLMPIAPPRRRPPRPSRGVPRWVPIAGMVIALLAALFALGKLGGGGDGDNGTVASTPTSRTTTTRVPATAATRTTTTARTRKRKPAASPNVVRLQLVPTGEVFVCLQDASGKLVVNGATLRPGSTAGPFRSRKFTMRVGNGNLRLRLNGRTRGVGNGSPMGYIITRKAVTRVDPAKTPDCGRTG